MSESVEILFIGGPKHGERIAIPPHSVGHDIRVPFIPEGGLDRWWEREGDLPLVNSFATATYRVSGSDPHRLWFARMHHTDWPKPPVDRPRWPRLVLFPRLARWFGWT